MSAVIRGEVLTQNKKRSPEFIKQKDSLENHAKKLTQYLDDKSIGESVIQKVDVVLPGVKLDLPFPDRQNPTRSSIMKKLPRRGSSLREKKKNSNNPDKKGARKSASLTESDKKAISDAVETGPQKVTCVATYEERPRMTSLNISDLMLMSADKGDLATLQVLVDKPCDYSLCVVKDENGETPLHKTAKGGYLKCMKYLSQRVPDEVSIQDNRNLTPAAHASQHGHVNCLKWLVEETSAYVELAVKDGQSSLLHHAAKHGMEQCLTYLLAFMAKRKITTDVVDEKNQTPLHSAAQMGHLACVQTLVEHGADVLAKDTEELTPANLAYLNKHSLCSRYLIMAESCWILSSRVSTLFREVNKYKRENKQLKKSLESLNCESKPCSLPNRPETVGAHTNDSVDLTSDCLTRDSEQAPIGSRNFPDGESPKSTFTEADKQRPLAFQPPHNHVINQDAELGDVKHNPILRQSSFTVDHHVTPTVSSHGIGEISPAEKTKAKEIAMVTHQLMLTRHLEIVQSKKNVKVVELEEKKYTLDDTAVVVVRRTSVSRPRDSRPKSLCYGDMTFMRSNTDIDFVRKAKERNSLERRASCTEINAIESNNVKETKEKTFWDKVGAKKLLSRKKSLKSASEAPQRTGKGLSDLETVSTDKILELYARETHASSTKLDSAMGQRSASTSDMKVARDVKPTRDAVVHASFREPRPRFQPMVPARMSERFTPSTASAREMKKRDSNEPAVSKTAEKKMRPVAKPRQKLRKTSSTSSEGSLGSKNGSLEKATVKISEIQKPLENVQKPRDQATWATRTGTNLATADEELECTDV